MFLATQRIAYAADRSTLDGSLPGEGAATVAGPAAVGVDDDLAAGQAGVTHWPADDELAGRVDQHPRRRGVQRLVRQVRQDGLEHVLADVGIQRLLEVDAVGVLGGNHHGVESGRDVVLVLDGDLRLAVRAQIRQRAVLAHLGQPPRQPVCQCDRQRHQLRGVADRVAEHQALVAGALGVQRVRGALDARLVRGVDALSDVGRLTADADVDAAGLPVEALVRVVVADVEDALANGVGDVGEGLLGRRRHLADHVHLPGGHQRLDGDT